MVEISENAGKLINKMVARHGFAQGGLRIGIKAGGCSGLSYVFDWEPAAKDGDHVFEGPEGSRVFIDPKSFRFIDGTTLVPLTEKLYYGGKVHARLARKLTSALVTKEALARVASRDPLSALASEYADQESQLRDLVLTDPMTGFFPYSRS